ncbi:MAG: class I SAM-dependent methyltransferase [Chloroflexota bacterium]
MTQADLASTASSWIGFDRSWLELRRAADDRAIAVGPVRALQRRLATCATVGELRVVDLGSGAGVALQRLSEWLPDRRMRAYAVDLDQELLAAPVAVRTGVTRLPLLADALLPLDEQGGPPDGWADLVVSHAFADLVPVQLFAERVARLLTRGGLAHLALTYDGNTVFSPRSRSRLETAVLAGYHRHMRRTMVGTVAATGAQAGSELQSALESCGLITVKRGRSRWRVGVAGRTDGPSVLLLERVMRFVADGATAAGVDAVIAEAWLRRRQTELSQEILSVRVDHVDLLVARRH